MSALGIILLVFVVVILFGGIGPWAPGGIGYGYGGGGIGVIGILLVVLILLLLTGYL
jgi:hypothetical protein